MSYVPKRDLLAFADHAIPRVNGVVFGESDGLPKISCYGAAQPMAGKDGNGVLWFTTQQGVLALNANALKSDPRPPPIFVDAVLVNDQTVPVDAGKPLPPMPRKLEFRFAVLWIPNGSRRQAARPSMDGCLPAPIVCGRPPAITMAFGTSRRPSWA
jgi:hypothetical protein